MPEPCNYRQELTGSDRERLKLGHLKRWSRCGHPDLPLRDHKGRPRILVCGCTGCGPKCPGYTVESDETKGKVPESVLVALRGPALSLGTPSDQSAV